MPNMQPYRGIIPYGSTDPSVLLQCSMTSLAECQAKGGAEVSAGNSAFDSVLGMKSNTTGAGIRFSTPTGYADLDYAGQLSFDIETVGICVTSTSLPSVGTDWAANTQFCVMRPAAATTNYFRAYMDAAERMGILWNVNGSTAGTNNPGASGYDQTSHGKDRFTRLTFSWVGSRYAIYINGDFFFEGSRGGYPTANIGERIEMMSGAGLGNAMVGIYCRNLLVSNKPVYWSNTPGGELLGIVGHSYASRARMTYTDFYRDRAWGVMLEGELHRLGLDVTLPKDNTTIFNSSGATILRSGGNPLKTQVDLFKVTNCTIGVYVGGTNDVINAGWTANRVQTLADIKLDLADMLSGPKCKRVVYCNCPSNIGNATNYATSGNDADTLEFNSDVNGLPAWWDAANPTRAGALVQARIFEALGGLTPPQENFLGTLLGTYTDLHPSALAHKILAKTIAGAIAATFMRPQP